MLLAPGLLALSFLALPAVTQTVAAQQDDPVRYRVSFENARHHEAHIDATFSRVGPSPLTVVMSRSSPGRYALHEFAKNVYAVSARDSGGRELLVERTSINTWRVSGHDGTVTFSYVLFGDRCDGTYSAIDETHAHLNAPATFAWARGLEDRAVEVRLDVPDTWRIASQLPPGPEANVLVAENLAYLLDSPIEASDHEVYSWTVSGPGDITQEIVVALHHEGKASDAEIYVAATKAIVAEQIAIFGEPPRFDHGRYTFIADYLPWANGDGMEHRNSTILTSSSSLERNLLGLLGTVSHEFLHAWNVERIRPRSLEPFDFERANVASELWFGEGFTSYYDRLTLVRAGLLSKRRYFERLSGQLDFVINSAGHELQGPAAMSRLAPFVDAATWIDPTNRSNTYISYYTYGAVLGLALDLELRDRFGRTLDDLMALIWRRHGRSEMPYEIPDLERALAEVTDAQFARSWFESHVLGHELPDYAGLLADFGLTLQLAEPGRAWIGAARFEEHAGSLRIASSTRSGSPLHDAGLNRLDEVLAANGVALEGVDDLYDVVGVYEPGDALPLRVRSRGIEEDVRVILQQDPTLEVVPFETEGNRAGTELTDSIRQLRDAWLGSKSTHDHGLLRECPDDSERFPFDIDQCPRHDRELLPLSPAAPPHTTAGSRP